MKHFLKFLLFGLFIECASYLCYIMASKTAFKATFKYLFIWLFLSGMLVTFIISVRVLNKKKLLLLISFLTFGFSIFYSIIGFLWFPGLLKDLDFASFYYFSEISRQMIIVFTFYGLLAIVCRLIWLIIDKIGNMKYSI